MILAPVDGGLGDHGKETHDGPGEEEGAKDEWEELANKYDQLEKKVKEYLGDQEDAGARGPPVISAPPKMSKEEREKH